MEVPRVQTLCPHGNSSDCGVEYNHPYYGWMPCPGGSRHEGVPRGFVLCDECEDSDGIIYRGGQEFPCPSCSGSGLVPTQKLREWAQSRFSRIFDELEATGFVAVDARGTSFAHVDSLVGTLRRAAWKDRAWRLSVKTLNRDQAWITVKESSGGRETNQPDVHPDRYEGTPHGHAAEDIHFLLSLLADHTDGET